MEIYLPKNLVVGKWYAVQVAGEPFGTVVGTYMHLAYYLDGKFDHEAYSEGD